MGQVRARRGLGELVRELALSQSGVGMMLPGLAAAKDGPGGWTGHSILQVWEGLKWPADITLAVASRSCVTC